MSYLEELKKDVLNAVEALVKKQLELKFDEAMNKALEKAKEAIPGEKYDFLVDIVGSKLVPVAKEELLKLADKIDGEVG